ncbi:MAG: peptide ABC transporter substrate-binding protein, partial [Chlamydiia bacterium]|nr:peptide ABC transporter substrate-binding protein [Chlamydiia bacterium]
MKYLLFCLAAALFLGCQSTPGAVKQKLRINFQTDPPTLDPRKGGDMTSSMMHFLLFEGLTRQTPDGPTELGVAKQIDISEDKLTYTFYLREANWSDGTPITAHDFEYTWKTMLNPTFPCFNAHLLFPIKNARAAKLGEIPLDAVGVSAADDKTLVVKLEAPTPYFLDLTAFCALYPVCKTAVENDASWSEGPPHHYACNGPFRLVEWKHCNQLKLEKNPHYWERAKVELEEIKVSLIENEHTALQLFEKGKLDIMGSAYTHIPTDATAKFKQLGLLKDYQVPATTACSFNTTKPPFNNIHLRKALSLAIDREAIVKNITRLSDEPAFTILHPALLSWNPLHMAEDVSAAIYFQKGLIELGLKAEDLP